VLRGSSWCHSPVHTTLLRIAPLTCDVVLDVQHVAQGVVVLEHVQVEGSRVLPDLGPHAVVGRRPASGQHVVVPLREVDQLGQGVVEAAVEAHHQLELRVRVQVHLSVGCVLHLGGGGGGGGGVGVIVLGCLPVLYFDVCLLILLCIKTL